MKRNISLLLVIMIFFTLMLTSCSSGIEDNLIMATGGTTGIYYSFGGAIAEVFNKEILNMHVTAKSTGASAENCKLLGTNQAELAILQNDVLNYAYYGTEDFKNLKIDNIRAIASLYPEIVQIVADENIDTIEDLKGKRVSVGGHGSGVELNARQILGVAGLSYSDINVSYLSFSESAEAYEKGQIDAFFITSGIPNVSIENLATKRQISFISLSDEFIDKLIKRYPFFSEYTISENSYENQVSDIKSVAVMATLATNEEMSEKEIYNITKALFEYKSELAGKHDKGKEISLENAIASISIPLHPGAEKYYKEAGILK